jgi:nicotinamidase-related amidase
MATIPDRPNTALVVIDVQNDVVAGAHERDRVVANISSLVERARAEAVPVIWVQHSDADLPHGTEGWQLVPELAPADEEPVVHKSFGDAFEETDLEEVLGANGVGRLVVTGAQTDQCVRSTIHGALVRGYDTQLVADAHTTEDNTAYGAPPPAAVIAHTNLYWQYQDAPGRTAGTVATADVSFGPTG